VWPDHWHGDPKFISRADADVSNIDVLYMYHNILVDVITNLTYNYVYTTILELFVLATQQFFNW